MSSILIARALVELKTLDSRINKITDSTQWIVYKKIFGTEKIL